MDPNEFSLDALLSCCEFLSVESAKTSYSFNEFQAFLKKNVTDFEISSEIEALVEDYACSKYNDAFKQGFCFAVKSIKFMLKI